VAFLDRRRSGGPDVLRYVLSDLAASVSLTTVSSWQWTDERDPLSLARATRCLTRCPALAREQSLAHLTTDRKIMATTAKVASPPTAKPPARQGSKAAAAAAGNEPFLRFHHSLDLRAKTDAVLAALEDGPDDAGHGTALADLVAELTGAGMDYYFLRPLRLAQVGFVAEQSARLGMSGAVKLISSVSRRFIVRMDREQLLVVAMHLRALAR
jgi:hypothetical protein